MKCPRSSCIKVFTPDVGTIWRDWGTLRRWDSTDRNKGLWRSYFPLISYPRSASRSAMMWTMLTHSPAARNRTVPPCLLCHNGLKPSNTRSQNKLSPPVHCFRQELRSWHNVTKTVATGRLKTSRSQWQASWWAFQPDEHSGFGVVSNLVSHAWQSSAHCLSEQMGKVLFLTSAQVSWCYQSSASFSPSTVISHFRFPMKISVFLMVNDLFGFLTLNGQGLTLGVWLHSCKRLIWEL